MNSHLVFVFILELVLIYLTALVFYYLLLLRRKIKITERLNPFSVYKEQRETKFFDDFFNTYDKFIKMISKFLYKIKIFNNYSLKYQKYIKKEENTNIDKMDFVSKKVLLMIVFILILVTFNMVKYQSITILQVIITGLIGFYALDIFLLSEAKLLKKEQENDLLKAITIMNNSFKSGHSIMQAIKLVSTELDSPLGLEFKKMYVDLTYGLSLDVVFKRFESRVKLDDVKYITTSLTILNETGGDIVKVFESVEKTFFNNRKLDDELKNLTAASKLLYYVLLFIPIVFVLFIYLLDSTYFNPLFTGGLGYLIIALILLLYISYIVVIKRIMKVGMKI